MHKEVLLSYFPKMSVAKYERILEIFSSLDAAWEAPREAWEKVGWDEAVLSEFLKWKERVEERNVQAALTREGIRAVTRADAEYPPLLKQIYDPPFCLFVRGSIERITCPLAVVGTRAATPYGRQIVEEIIPVLAAHGVTVVSGLALGIDGLAHEATIAAGGKTVAVLGTGIDREHIYPAAHTGLSERIVAAGGAVISEYPPGSEATKFSFPRRNRIIAGMSLATLVIEAGEKSGALITAACSLECGRDVLAVPQNITSPTASGPHALIKNGAAVITSAQDVLDALHLEALPDAGAGEAIRAGSAEEEKILSQLSRQPIHVDAIIKQTGLASQTVNGILALMEMQGKVKNVGGMMYVRGR